MENDIEPMPDTDINIPTDIKYEKFLKFYENVKYFGGEYFHTGEYIAEKGFTFVINDLFIKKHLTKKDKMESLKRMYNYLLEHIDKEIEEEISRVKYKIIEEIREKYPTQELLQKIESMQATSEAA